MTYMKPDVLLSLLALDVVRGGGKGANACEGGDQFTGAAYEADE